MARFFYAISLLGAIMFCGTGCDSDSGAQLPDEDKPLSIEDIEKRGLAVGLKLLRSQVRHLGTEVNLKLLTSIYEQLLKDGVKMLFNTHITDIIVEKGEICGVVDEKCNQYLKHF